MRKPSKTLWLFIFFAAFTAPVHAAGLEATLDQYEIRVTVDQPAVLEASLSNSTTSTLYLTGVQVVLTDGASGDVYNPALLQERLRKLDPGQSWDGPLVVVRAKHRGPLLVKGSIVVKGGTSSSSAGILASLPLSLTIDDPRRNLDGSYDRSAKPSCSRPADSCCDPSESLCFQVAARCIYVSEGYDRQKVCVNQVGGKVYEHITDLQVSSDAAHVAYVASFQCQSGDHEEHCKRIVVLDQVEQTGVEVPTHLRLSPDGRHYAYAGRQACVVRLGEDVCTGASHPIVDGSRADALPNW